MSRWWNVALRAAAYTVPLLALAIILYSDVAGAVTTVPTKMNFQGRLTDSSGNSMANGTYNMRLKLFTVSSGGSNVWSEDRLVSAAQGVTVTNGLFSIQLGDITPLSASLFASGALYLEVELPTPATATSSSPSWTEGAMTPRNQLATSAYAYNAETLDGLDSAAFGQLNQNNTWTGTNTIQASNTSAFGIQNGSGVGVLRVDTTGEAGNVISNGSVEINSTGWSALGAATATRVTSTATYGEASMQVATTTSANDGIKYDVTLSDSTQYTASFYAKLNSGTFTAMAMGYSNDGTTGGETNCKTGITIVTGGWSQVNCTFTTPASHSGTPYFYMKQPFGGTARTYFVDGFHMIPGSNIGAYYDGQVKTSAIFNHIAVQDAEDSQTAFQVQAANGTSVFNVDTINKRVGIGTNSPNARLHVGTITASSIGLIVKGMNSQTGNLAEFQDNNNNILSGVTAQGNMFTTGNTRTNINSLGAQSEGTMTYDQTNDRMLVYSSGKWQADRNDAVLVAASDSSQADKDAADYVADGTADQSEINTALTAASSSGSRKTGKVYLFAGTYTINASVTVPNNVTIAGSGNSTVITIPNSLNSTIYGVTNTTTDGTGTGITVRDLRLEGNESNQSSGTMNGIYINGVASSGGVVKGATVTNVTANAWRTAAFYVNSTGNSHFTNNTASGKSSYGIAAIATSDSTFSGNGIDLGSNTGTRGIYLSGGGDNTFTGNTIKNTVAYGMYVATTSGNTISGNTLLGDGTNSIEGLYLSTAVHNSIIGNTIKSYSANIELLSTSDYNTISGNTVSSGTSGGVYLDTSDYNIVSNNNFYDNGGSGNNDAIVLFAADRNTITDNSIYDSSATTTNYAIDITSGTSNYIADNNLSTGSVNDSGTSTVQAGQLQSGSTFDINGGGNTIRLDSAEVVLSQNLLRSSPSSDLTLQGGTGGGSAIVLKADASSSNNGVIIENGYLRSANGVNLTIRAGNSGSANIVIDGANIDFTQGLGAGAGVTSVCINGSNRLKAATSVCANPSSIAYKENVQDMGSTLDLLSRLRPVRFDWKDGVRYTSQSGTKNDFGLIAQDVQGVIPTLVSYNEDGSVQGLNYSGFVPFLIKGVQEQQTQIGQLQGDVLAIQAMNQRQQNQIGSANNTNDSQQTSINSLKNSVTSLVQNAATTNLSDGSMDITVDGATFGGGVVMNGSLNVSGPSTVGKLTVTKSLAVAKDLTVGGSITTTDITLNGHIITAGNTPEITVKPAAGVANATNSIAAPEVTIEGNDTSGTITVTAGKNGVADALATITFAKPFDTTPRIVLSAANRASVDVGVYYDASSTSTTGFDLRVASAPQAGRTYVFNYYIVQ